MRRNRAARFWLGGAATLSALLLAAYVDSAASNGDYEDELNYAQTRARFYRVVASDLNAPPSSVDVKLALDLRAAIDEDRVDEFRGHSNLYGGIERAIGEDPFVSDGCFECGPLSPEMRANIEEIKKGRVEEVIRADRPEEPEAYTEEVSVSLAIWTLLGAGLLFSPSLLNLRRRQSEADKLRAMDPEAYRLLETMENTVRQLPPGDNRTSGLLDQINSLRFMLKKKVEEGDNWAINQRIRDQTEQAQITMQAYEETDKLMGNGS